MAPWPPSPSVEDEITALANEHSIDASIHALKSENQPAPERGSVDQCPVIIDPSDRGQFDKSEGESTPTPEPLVTDISSSEDCAGPPTPPPLFRKEQKKSNYSPSTTPPESNGSRLPSCPPAGAQQQPSNRGRPQVTRIQTDVGADISPMVTGNRRPPSPYSFTRTPTFPGTSVGRTVGAEPLLLPTHTVASPNLFANGNRQARMMDHSTADRLAVPHYNATVDEPQQVRPRSQRGSSQTSHSNSQSARSSASHLESGAPYRPSQDGRRQSYHEEQKRYSAEYAPLSPPHSRRQSNASGFGSSSDDRPKRHSPPYSRRGTQESRHSPHTSSAEDSSRNRAQRAEREARTERQWNRRGSSHHHEKPILVDPRFSSNVENAPSSATGSSQTRYYRYEPRNEPHLQPLTPHTGDLRFVAATAEDIFDRAFRENASRTRKERSPRSSGSALVSPLASPPRTPKNERLSKDYFDQTPTLQRPTQRSRPPSMDEGQIRDLRMHSTLLSAATAGAAIAARSSNATTKSSGQSTENSSSSATSKAPSAPRSRRPSPVLENRGSPARAAVYNPTDQHLFSSATLQQTHDARPISRGSTTVSDTAQYFPHPHRALSYSGPEYPPNWSRSNPPSAISPTYNSSMAMPTGDNFAPQSRSARSSMYSAESSSTAKDTFGLPICPRSQPTIGYHDWYTVKEIYDIDICPTCISTIGNTRYRDLFVKSLPRPYNEPSVCAMSKPWIRIAFAQALKQDQPNLEFVRKAATLPKETRACAGGKCDIRSWFRVTDPQTRTFIPDFYACSACIRVVDAIFSPVCSVFVRPDEKLIQERTCSLRTNGKHFQSLTEELDRASVKCKGRKDPRPSDVEPLVHHIRRVARYQPCPRDENQANRAWHFLPELPDFTICESCYDEVVCPVDGRYIARDIGKTLRTVPQTKTNQFGNSCQLYSDRMRRTFLEAVNRRDFTLLRDAVQTRANHQRRLNEMNRLYEQDMRFGIDRRADIERNRQIWRGIE